MNNMNLNKEKFLSLVSKEKVNTAERNRERIRNREMYRVSVSIALKVLNRMDELDWSKDRLSDELDLPMEKIEEIISGKYNHTLCTLVKIQKVMGIPILINR